MHTGFNMFFVAGQQSNRRPGKCPCKAVHMMGMKTERRMPSGPDTDFSAVLLVYRGKLVY